MNILVTGGAGYVGSSLVPLLLAKGHRVRVLDSLLHGGEALLGVWTDPAFEFVKGDVRDAATVQHAVAGMDAVVHLAAIVGDPACAREPALARAVNLEGSLALIEAARRAGVKRFVFASTCSNYGKMADPTQYVDERSELRPVSLYAETKVAVEQAMLDAGAANGMAMTPLRFATVFGVAPRMRFDLTVNEFTRDMLTKEKLVVFGEQFWRPYVHVRDAARAVAMVLEAPVERVRGHVFNVGSTEQNYQKQQLVELIKVHAPKAVVEYVHKQEDPRDYRVSFARIASQLGYQTTMSVPDGIREVAQLVTNRVIADPDAARYRN
ncbi:MAG: NAD(P)-dependent oxidoreductase [Gemmatimonadaceae bacterium]|nr:NAD(P)-dependent oxidoreductase [Gemmatimonadaceae bacterium]